MTSTKQIKANRRNAKKSTGPKTPEGKSVSRTNAICHGLTAAQVVIAGEDPEDFQRLLESFREELCPEDAIQSQIVNNLAQLMWRLRRIPLFEAALLTWLQRIELRKDERGQAIHRIGPSVTRLPLKANISGNENNATGRLQPDAQFHNLNALGRTIQAMLEKQDYFNKLSRYQSALARDFERNLHLLRRIKGDGRRHSMVGQVGESSVSTRPTVTGPRGRRSSDSLTGAQQTNRTAPNSGQ